MHGGLHGYLDIAIPSSQLHNNHYTLYISIIVQLDAGMEITNSVQAMVHNAFQMYCMRGW